MGSGHGEAELIEKFQHRFHMGNGIGDAFPPIFFLCQNMMIVHLLSCNPYRFAVQIAQDCNRL